MTVTQSDEAPIRVNAGTVHHALARHMVRCEAGSKRESIVYGKRVPIVTRNLHPELGREASYLA